MGLIVIGITFLSGFGWIRSVLASTHFDFLTSRLAKIVTAVFCSVVFFVALNIFERHSTFVTCLAILASCGFAVIATSLTRFQIKSRKKFVPMHQVFEEVLGLMTAGQSFRTAWLQMCQTLSAPQRQHYEKLLEHVAFSQQNYRDRSKLDQKLLSEIERIDQEPHLARQRVCEVRDRLQMIHSFRRRSRQLTLQVRMQAWILATFFAALVFVQIGTRPWTPFLAKCLFMSLGLFGFGFFLLLRAPRRF